MAKLAEKLRLAREGELKGLVKIANECFVPHAPRYHERPYLRAVYKLYLKWLADRRAKARARQLAKLYETPWRRDKHPIGMIIDCSAPGADGKMRSKWSLALRFAHAKDIPASKLSSFMDEHDGMAGCARAFAALNKKSKQYQALKRKPQRRLASKGKQKRKNAGVQRSEQGTSSKKTMARRRDNQPGDGRDDESTSW
jgi:hypothetical protein